VDGYRFQVTCNFAVVEYPSDGLTIQSLYQVAAGCNIAERRR